MEKNRQLNKLFDYPAVFIKTVVKFIDLPTPHLPEVAFAGRSNVGKSSLLNALFNRNQLARTSNTPGRTQALNFFCIRNLLHFVDMPGYGYARAAHSEIRQWLPLINEYIINRPVLRRIYVLIDVRHGFKSSDLEFMHYLDTLGLSYQIVLTKIDKVSRHELLTQVATLTQIITSYIACYPPIIATSSSKKSGLTELKQSIIDLIDVHLAP